MSFVLVKGAGGSALLSDAWRIPAAEVAPLRTALEAAHALDADRADAADRLAVEREHARADGYAAGLEEGRRAGGAAAAQSLAALVREVRAQSQAARAELGRVALEVVRRIAAEIGPQTMLEAVAERAVRDTLSQQPLVVRVAETAAPGVAARLWPLNAEVEVIADPAVAEGDCVIASRSGAAHAGLEVQLSALERAFAEAAP